MVRASSRTRSRSVRNAPLPAFTSSTSASMSSATFFDTIELAMSGRDSTSTTRSRSAYSVRSAGATSRVCAQITAPASRSTSRIASSPSSVRTPGTASSLSRVPPVCPRPRPEIIGTTMSMLASSGARGRLTLSPIPPVECACPPWARRRRTDRGSGPRRPFRSSSPRVRSPTCRGTRSTPAAPTARPPRPRRARLARGARPRSPRSSAPPSRLVRRIRRRRSASALTRVPGVRPGKRCPGLRARRRRPPRSWRPTSAKLDRVSRSSPSFTRSP